MGVQEQTLGRGSEKLFLLLYRLTVSRNIKSYVALDIVVDNKILILFVNCLCLWGVLHLVCWFIKGSKISGYIWALMVPSKDVEINHIRKTPTHTPIPILSGDATETREICESFQQSIFAWFVNWYTLTNKIKSHLLKMSNVRGHCCSITVVWTISNICYNEMITIHYMDASYKGNIHC